MSDQEQQDQLDMLRGRLDRLQGHWEATSTNAAKCAEAFWSDFDWIRTRPAAPTDPGWANTFEGLQTKHQALAEYLITLIKMRGEIHVATVTRTTLLTGGGEQ